LLFDIKNMSTFCASIMIIFKIKTFLLVWLFGFALFFLNGF